MLELLGQLTDGLGELAVDRIARTARRCRVMRLVEDQQRTRSECAKKITQAGNLGLIGQQVVRDDETRPGGPWIDAEATQSAQVGDAFAIDDRKSQPEFGLEFVLPLQRHRWRCGYDREVDAPPQQQLAQDQRGLDRLAEADVVGAQHRLTRGSLSAFRKDDAEASISVGNGPRY